MYYYTKRECISLSSIRLLQNLDSSSKPFGSIVCPSFIPQTFTMKIIQRKLLSTFCYTVDWIFVRKLSWKTPHILLRHESLIIYSNTFFLSNHLPFLKQWIRGLLILFPICIIFYRLWYSPDKVKYRAVINFFCAINKQLFLWVALYLSGPHPNFLWAESNRHAAIISGTVSTCLSFDQSANIRPSASESNTISDCATAV